MGITDSTSEQIRPGVYSIVATVSEMPGEQTRDIDNLDLHLTEDNLLRLSESGSPFGTGVTLPVGAGNGTGSISSKATELLIEILKTAIYSANVSGKIEQLQEALAQGGSSGDSGGDSSDSDTPSAADDITVTDGIMTIISVGSEVSVTDGIMTIL